MIKGKLVSYKDVKERQCQYEKFREWRDPYISLVMTRKKRDDPFEFSPKYSNIGYKDFNKQLNNIAAVYKTFFPETDIDIYWQCAQIESIIFFRKHELGSLCESFSLKKGHSDEEVSAFFYNCHLIESEISTLHNFHIKYMLKAQKLESYDSSYLYLFFTFRATL